MSDARTLLFAAALVAACTSDQAGTGGSASSSGDVGSSSGTSPATSATAAASSTTRTAPGESGASGTGAESTGDGNACNDSPQALADCVEAARYTDDLEFVTGVRTPASGHWQAVQDLCADRLAELGYEVQLFDYGTGVDVLGRRDGVASPEEIVLVGAHYDHIPGCDGADDNATGLAATLEIARVLAMAQTQRTLVVACWDEEETGLVGSTAFVDSAVAEGIDIVTYVNFDMIGYFDDAPDSQQIPPGLDLAFPDAYADLENNDFRGDFIAVVTNAGALPMAMDFEDAGDRVDLRSVLLALPAGSETSDLFADLRRSDHAAFWDNGFPALFVTDTAEFRNPHYHCAGGPDTIDDLDRDRAVAVTRATVEAAALGLGL